MGRTEGESVDGERNLYWSDSKKSLSKEEIIILWGRDGGERRMLERKGDAGGVGEERDKRMGVSRSGESGSVRRRVGE